MRSAEGLFISFLMLVMFSSQASAQPGSVFGFPSKDASLIQNVDDRRYKERRSKHRSYGYRHNRPYYPPPYYGYAYPYPAPYPYYAPYPQYYGPNSGVSLSFGF